ncbi:MAG: MFS transporter [Alphaproteobacteria bacterium]|nr:MFS transporter [Alphaproteobacteria bacterium]
MTSAAEYLSPRPAPSKDGRVIGVIGSAHFTSHFFQMVIPPLFPVMKDAFGVGYTELGLLMTVFYAVSGIGQPIAGFVVDRVGARSVLVGGIALMGLSMILVALAPHYWIVLALMVPAGLGNSVFHPADYSILSASVSPGRMGRAFSVHAFGGTMGWALAPVVMLSLSAVGGWRTALVVVGVAAFAVALLVRMQHAILREDRAGAGASHGHAPGAPAAGGVTWQLLLSLPILMCFAYFLFLAVAGIALQNFLAPTLEVLHGTPIAVGAAALTTYLFGSACGIILGGFAADRIQRHEVLVAVGLFSGAALILLVGQVAFPPLALNVVLCIAGFMSGTATAARDMLVRNATPKGATGKVFGFVYSGLDLGSTVAPGLAGFLIDHHNPAAVLWLVAAGQVMAVSTAFGLRRRRRAVAPQPAE